MVLVSLPFECSPRIVCSSKPFFFTDFRTLDPQWSKRNSFVINRLRTLFNTTEGWEHSGSLRSLAQPVYECPLPSLCFQQLPTVKFCNSFVLITMQNAPGVYTPSLRGSE